MVMYGSDVGNIDRTNWRARVKNSGLTLAELAWRTDTTVRSTYAYSQGKRRPSDAWIERVERALNEYAWEWTCTMCLVRNDAKRISCRGCGRSNDGYLPSVIKATNHGSAQ